MGLRSYCTRLDPWYDIICGICYSVIATIQIVPDDKPMVSTAAVARDAS
jgi:hypothetical protein